MAILSFSDRFARRTAAADWSSQEMADFYRAHRLLVQHGVDIGLDRGVTDEGEPWAVFFDAASQDVFLHIARIGGKCILVCESLSINISARDVSGLITAFEGEILQLVTTRSARASNVVLHPVTRILVSISAVFLLFKLENGGSAHAKGMDGEAAALDDMRKEHSLSHRASSAVTRLFDIIDTPAAVAALASVLVTVELAKWSSAETAAHAHASDMHHRPVDVALVPIEPEARAVQSEANSDQIDVRPEQIVIATDASQPSTLDLDVVIATPGSAIPQIVTGMTAFPGSAYVPEPQSVARAEPTERKVEKKAEARVETKVVATLDSDSQPILSSKDADKDAKATDFAQVLLKNLGSDSKEASLSGLFLIKDGGKATADLGLSHNNSTSDMINVSTRAATLLGDVTPDTLGDILNVVGLVYETRLSDDKLLASMADLLKQLPGFSIEFAATDVLIEQVDIAGVQTDHIGVWSNLMSDGSRISIVGSLDIIDGLSAIIS